MNVLILSCGTGGGHNAAGAAVMEEMKKRGHYTEMFDPNDLVTPKLSTLIGNGYIKPVQNTPHLFGLLAKIGEDYRKLPLHTPVYAFNYFTALPLYTYLKKHHFDVVVMTHPFPPEMMVHIKKWWKDAPITVSLGTDYYCVPFLEEDECDYYICAHQDSIPNYMQYGIPEDKIKPFGIPVREEFSTSLTADEAKAELGLEKDVKYYLIAGGSIGAGDLKNVADVLYYHIKLRENTEMIIICGNNEKEYKRLKERYGDKALVMKTTDKMALYMKASKMYFSKPGGLSSTEAAVMGVPILHTAPIPGTEIRNQNFFVDHGMSVAVKSKKKDVLLEVMKLENKETRRHMEEKQKATINANARCDICDWLETLV